MAPGKPNPIAILGQKPLGYRIGVLLAVMVVLGFAYWQLFYSSLNDELTSETRKEENLQKRNKELKQREKEWRGLIEKKDEIDRQLAKNRVSLPSTADVTSFMGHLEREAANAGLRPKNLKIEPEVPNGPYVRVPVSVEVEGTFFQFIKYMRLLADTKRITSVENFKLTRRAARNPNESLLSATFLAVTFRLAEGPKPPPTEPAQPSSKPDGAKKDSVKSADGAQSSGNAYLDKAKDAKAALEKRTDTATGDSSSEPAAGAP